MKIIVTGPKGTGKTTVGRLVSERLGLPFIETDGVVSAQYEARTGKRLSCREISATEGSVAFRALERAAVAEVASRDWCVIATGGSTFVNIESRTLLRRDALVAVLSAPAGELWERVSRGGIPAYLSSSDPRREFSGYVNRNLEVMRRFADVEIDTAGKTPAQAAQEIVDGIALELSIRSRSPNTFGDVIRVTTFGESHGPAIGCVLDGVPPGIEISAGDIQKELDRRRPGQSAVSTPRKERDQVRILSGIFEGRTTGAPVCLVLMSEDQRPSAYEGIREVFRPGHADFTFWRKYGIRDHRGGGRSSGRETAGRVAAGAVARKILEQRGVTITAYALEIAGIRAETIDCAVIENNPVRCPDMAAAKKMEAAILAARDDKDSVGGIIELRVTGVPAGLGDPVFDKLDARLAHAILSIGATKGFEVGRGFAAAKLRGSENNDAMKDGAFVTNNAGGITGGISNGNEIIIRIAVKPTSSIEKPQQTIGINGENREVVVEGRHDPCIVPRIIPVIEAMTALVLYDAWEMQAKLRPGWK